MAKVTSPLNEQRLRDAFAQEPESLVRGAVLVRRLAACNLTRQAANMAIGNATRCRLLLRSGAPGRYAYRLNPKWERPATPYARIRAVEDVADAQARTVATAWPAFGACSLAPTLGPRPADPEVIPPEVADLVDSLHQRFFRHARGVEV